MDDAPCQNCHVCGTEGSLLYESLHDRLFSVSERWNLRKCNNAECGSLWMDPMPLVSELHRAYKSYYTRGNGDPGSGVFRRQVLARRTSHIRRPDLQPDLGPRYPPDNGGDSGGGLASPDFSPVGNLIAFCG